MRQLAYYWRFRPDTFGFSSQNWPEAGVPFSIFTSSYGSSGKQEQSGFGSNSPTNAWDRKQISSLPIVSADQFVVINNFGSSPGLLPIPDVLTTNRDWIGTFEIKARITLTPALFIWDLSYAGYPNPYESDSKAATIARLENPAKSYFNTNITKTAGDGTKYWKIESSNDIEDLYSAWLEPYGVVPADITITSTVTSANYLVYSVSITFIRYGSTEGGPITTTLFSPSLADRRRDSVSTVVAGATTIDFYENIKPNGFLQLMVNDTSYFQEPIHTQALGISGDAAPFPQTVGFKVPQWSLKPNYYVLPGQSWDIQYTTMNDIHALNDWIVDNLGNAGAIGAFWTYAEVFCSYYLYEGANAMICHQLLKLGITINPDTIDWYKRQILAMEGLDPNTYEVYLDLQSKWKEKQNRLDEHYSRGRHK
jgi:hypothetical protein